MSVPHRRDRSQRGYAMVALLVALSVMGVMLGAALPVYSTMARREREAELVFRGEQYARAIRLYQQQYANALPPDVETLVGMRFLRREYLDPITRDEFQYLGPNDPELAEALNSEPAGARDDDEGEPEDDFQQRVREMQDALDRTRGFVEGLRGSSGGIVAVTSTSTDESLRLYNGRDHYNEWVFIALQTSQQAGAPPGVGGEAGGRGGATGGLQLQPDGRGRGGIGGRGGRGGRGDAGPRGGGRRGNGGGGRGGFGGRGTF